MLEGLLRAIALFLIVGLAIRFGWINYLRFAFYLFTALFAILLVKRAIPDAWHHRRDDFQGLVLVGLLALILGLGALDLLLGEH